MQTWDFWRSRLITISSRSYKKQKTANFSKIFNHSCVRPARGCNSSFYPRLLTMSYANPANLVNNYTLMKKKKTSHLVAR